MIEDSPFKYFLKDLSYYIIIIIITFPVLFLKLGSFSIRLGDEAMYAVNVYEMLHHKSYLVPYFNNVMDVCNSKPPLVLWIQMGFVKMFGYNEVALRLPSALAGMGIILALFGFLKKRFSLFAGFAGALILVTAQGLHTFHSTRTCDPDAVAAFLITISNVIFLNAVITRSVNGRSIVLFFVFLTLAFWSKSLMALLFIPGMLVIVLADKELLLKLIKNRWFWVGSVFFLFSVCFFVLLRNHLQPGFLSDFLYRDAGRIIREIENHREPFMYYIWNFNYYRFTYWLMPALAAMLASLLLVFKNGMKKEYLAFAIVSLLFSYWFIISVSVTKLPWYDVPLYPLLAFIIAWITHRTVTKIGIPVKLLFLALLLFVVPYLDIFGINQTNSFSSFEEKNEAKEKYIHSMILRKKSLENYVAAHRGYEGGLIYYKYRLKEMGYDFRIELNGNYHPGENVIVSEQELKQQLERNYRFEIKDSADNVYVYRVIGSAGVFENQDSH